jgi:hypothetical protein
VPWGNRSLLLRDPDGNLVNFFTPCDAEGQGHVRAVNAATSLTGVG